MLKELCEKSSNMPKEICEKSPSMLKELFENSSNMRKELCEKSHSMLKELCERRPTSPRGSGSHLQKTKHGVARMLKEHSENSPTL